MILPEGFANTRFVFSLAGVVDEMGFSIATRNNGTSSPEDVAGDLSLAFAATFISSPGVMLEDWTYLGTRTTHNSLAGLITADYQTAIVGTFADAGLVVNTALLVRKTTNLGGRQNRGRLFVPPFNVSESAVSNAGNILPSFVASQVIGWAEFYDAMIADDHQPVLLHTNPATPPTDIASFVPQNLAATQRRRMR